MPLQEQSLNCILLPCVMAETHTAQLSFNPKGRARRLFSPPLIGNPEPEAWVYSDPNCCPSKTYRLNAAALYGLREKMMGLSQKSPQPSCPRAPLGSPQPKHYMKLGVRSHQLSKHSTSHTARQRGN